MFAGDESEPSVEWLQPCRRFDLPEILLATDDFDESLVIGHGGFGKVYRGTVIDGSGTPVDVAVKRLDSMSNQGAPEFWAEVEMLSKLRHCHLVSLIGYCNHENEMILVYEYLPLGTLSDHLHKIGTSVSWIQRLRISIGAARGLDYLHTGTGIEFGIIHRDVKTSNILLHESWAAKISDFGLSRIGPTNQLTTHVSTLVKGTFGYLDPNYFHTGNLTRKSDVYAFGVVLFEVLCRKRAVIRSLDEEQVGLAPWAQESIKEGKLKQIIDSEIRGEISPKCLKEFVGVAERCLHSNPKNRPTMAEVVFSLESVLSLQEKSNNSLETASKTIIGRLRDILPFTTNGSDSGMESGSLTTKKKKQLVPKKKSVDRNMVLSLKDKLRANGGFGFDSIKRFGAKELKEATDNYAVNRIIARGIYGCVYKGILSDNRVVAIKRFQELNTESHVKIFINEIDVLGQIQHRNVAQLLGWCLETEVPLLVHEFVSNGTLYDHLHSSRTYDILILSWDRRLRIAHELAGALAYLHSDARTSIIHRDVKSSNILLDGNYNAKITNFSVSRLVPLDDDSVTTVIVGTPGYLDPEYHHTSQVTHKSDVYSFGVVLAELLTRKRVLDIERDEDLASYFVKAKKENRWREILDSQVVEEATDVQLEAICELVLRCLDQQGHNRPTMKQVTMELKHIMEIWQNSKDLSRELVRKHIMETGQNSYGSSREFELTESFSDESEQVDLIDFS